MRKLILVGLFLLCPKIAISQDVDLNIEPYLLYKKGLYDSIINSLSLQAHQLNPSATYNLLGDCYRNSFMYDSAIIYYNQSLFNEKINVNEKVDGLLGLSLAHLDLFNLKKARPFIKKAEAIIDRYKLTSKLSVLYHAKGILSFSDFEGDPESYFLKSISKSKEEDPDIIDTYIYLIDLYIENRDFELVQKYSEKVISLLERNFKYHKQRNTLFYLTYAYGLTKSGKSIESLKILENEVFQKIKHKNKRWHHFLLAEYYRYSTWPLRRLGYYQKTIFSYKNYLNIIANVLKPNHLKYGEVYNSLSSLYQTLDFYELSDQYSDRAISVFLKTKTPDNLLSTYFIKCRSNYFEHEFDKSMAFSDSIIQFSIQSKIRDHFEFLSREYRSKIKFESGDYEGALMEIDKFQDYREKIGNQNYRSLYDTYFIKLSSLSKLGFEDKATIFLNEINQKLNLKKSYNDPLIIDFYNNFSDYLIENNHLDSARQYLDFVIQSNEGNPRSNSLGLNDLLYNKLAYTYHLRSKYFNNNYKVSPDLNTMENAYNDVISSIELYQKSIGTYKPEVDRFKDQKKDKDLLDYSFQICFDIYQKTHNQGYLSQAFHINEITKSNQLLQSINRNNAIQKSNIPDSLLLKINSLKQQASYLKSQIIKLSNSIITDSIQVQDYQHTLADNRMEFREVMLFLEENFPSYFESYYNPQLATIARLQDRLIDNEALIEYYIGNTATYVFTITNQGVNVTKSAIVPHEIIQNFKATIQPERFLTDPKESYLEFVNKSYDIYNKILAPSIATFDKNKIKKLFIIPDKHLNYLSYELLITEETKANEDLGYANLPMLINQYSISYGYSSSVLFRNYEKRQKNDNNTTNKLLAIAPSYKNLLKDSSELYKLGNFRNDVSELVFNKYEVDAVGNFFPSTVLKSQDATEQAFIKNLKSHDILHLAMHALINEEDPAQSKLIFSPNDDTLFDNYLYNFELYNMEINSKLAVLSACNTGDGNLEVGEGIMSLARAFTYAGAKSVVMSQWRVDDKASSSIMEYFYKNLSQGMNKDDALRNAKLEYLKNASYLKQHPFFWGNFVVMGDIQPISEDKGMGLFHIISISLLIVLLAIIFTFRKNIFSYFTQKQVP